VDKLMAAAELFEGRHFDREVIILCVRWYLRFKLSLRDLVEMMAERGLSMAYVLGAALCPGIRETLAPVCPGGRRVMGHPRLGRCPHPFDGQATPGGPYWG
jgi:hypothetical protein